MRIIGFNVPEGWARDISADVALEVQQRCDLQLRDVPFLLQESISIGGAIATATAASHPLGVAVMSMALSCARARLPGLAKFLPAIVLGLLAPCELAAQGLPVRTGSHVPVWIWFVGSGILGLALAYGIIRTRGRSRGERKVTEQATKRLYAEEERDRVKSGEP
jgi:hypothetical protein